MKAWVAHTSAGATAVATITLGTNHPRIDLRVENPVLKVVVITTETDPANSEIGTLALQSQRASTPDSTAEWCIADASSLSFYQTANEDGIAFVEYICYGSQAQ